jgi:tRNA pseudouridine55 synthase
MAQRRRRNRPEEKGLAGFIVVDKPSGMTSHDVVDEARRFFGARRIGHLGTLDPQATGVLPLAVRGATKLVSFFDASKKAYSGTVTLGITTDTLDAQGEVLTRFEGELPDETAVRAVLPEFMGEIEQVPPMYSAVKQGGVPLHELAREGKVVDRPPKKVHITALEISDFRGADFDLEVECSAGTYVRTLAADMGERLGCGAHLSALRRTRSGPFGIEQAHTLEALEAASKAGEIDDMLIPPQLALGFPVTELVDAGVRSLRNGGEIGAGELHRSAPGTRVSAIGPDGRMVGVLEMQPDRTLRSMRLLPPER